MVQELTEHRVRLSWAQFTWGIAVIIIMIGTWYDNRNRMDLALTDLRADLRVIQTTQAGNAAVYAIEMQAIRDRLRVLEAKTLKREVEN